MTRPNRRSWRWIISIHVVLGTAVIGWVHAKPMLPGSGDKISAQQLTEEMQTLSGLTSVRLIVRPLGEPLEDAGLTPAHVQTRLEKRLVVGGLEVADPDSNAPLLEVGGWSAGDENVPGGVAFTLYLKLHQRVQVERNHKRLVVPTYVKIAGGLQPEGALAAEARTVLDLMLKEFIFLVGYTSEQTR